MPLYLRNYLRLFGAETHYYGNAAHSFYDVMVWLQKHRPKKKPNIIMPVYIPAKLYRFVIAAGYTPKFYDVSIELDYNLNEIQNLIDGQTQAIFGVHYFGSLVDMHPLKLLTKQAGIFLIEDCAHTMNSHLNGKLIGSTGDFSLMSTRKMMQLYCGGILIANSPPWKFEPSENRHVSSLFTGYHLAGSRIKYTMKKYFNGIHSKKKLNIPYNGYIDLSEEQSVRVKRMDWLSRHYCQQIDLDTMAEVRRANMQFLLNNINDLTFIQPIALERNTSKVEGSRYTLNDGFVPFSLPVLTPPGKRGQIQRILLEKGEVCFAGWPEAPFGLKGFPQASELKERLLELPVHNYVTEHQLKCIVNCLNDLSPSHKKAQRYSLQE